jgi:hypothetical protein
VASRPTFFAYAGLADNFHVNFLARYLARTAIFLQNTIGLRLCRLSPPGPPPRVLVVSPSLPTSASSSKTHRLAGAVPVATKTGERRWRAREVRCAVASRPPARAEAVPANSPHRRCRASPQTLAQGIPQSEYSYSPSSVKIDLVLCACMTCEIYFSHSCYHHLSVLLRPSMLNLV